VALRRAHNWLDVTVRGDELVAEGVMQPQPGMRRYRVRITYCLGWHPKAEVLNPRPLRRHPDQRVAHTVGADHVPCLFTPNAGDWRSSMWLSHTIVPWLAEWLIFYEGWRATGRWHGGGTLPADYESPDRREPAA
jgi:hypothetical protein